MQTIRHRSFPGTPANDEILRRLGAALAIHWDLVGSEHAKTSLIYQAALMGSAAVKTEELRQELMNFIETHKA